MAAENLTVFGAVDDTRHGVTLPRIFTPPLRPLTKETSNGFAVIAFAEIMQGREDVSRYDPKTGRGVWTGAFEALEAALADSATGVSMMSDDGEVLNDPLTAARNRTREGMNLPVMSNETDANLIATLSADDSDEEPSSGIDVTVTKDIEGLDDFLNDESSQSNLDECEERFYQSLMPRPQNNQQ